MRNGWATAVMLLVTGCASAGFYPGSTAPGHVCSSRTSSDLSACYDIPLSEHPRVKYWIRYYTGPGRQTMRTFLERLGRYEPMMRARLHESGVPEDLVFVAMLESGFSTDAVSSAGAVGPWQFMPDTARRYGLQPTQWVDPRRDPELATIAAGRHFHWLHETLGDWYLAMAAYNAGAQRLKNARRRSGTADFWKIRDAGHFLPRETEEYVPKVLAMAIIAKHPQRYGLGFVRSEEPLDYDVVWVEDSLTLARLSYYTGATVEELRTLNPALLRGVTPPKRRWPVRVPRGRGGFLRQALHSSRTAARGSSIRPP